MVAKTISRDSQKAQLKSILQNGRQFLAALESYVATNFPDEEEPVTAVANECQADSGNKKLPASGESGNLPETSVATDEIAARESVTPLPPAVAKRPADAASPSTVARDAKRRRKRKEIGEDANTLVYDDDDDPNQNLATKKPAANSVARRSNNTEQNVQGNSPSKDKGAVLQFCSQTGNLLRSFASVNDAANAYTEAYPDTVFKTARRGIYAVLSGAKPQWHNLYFHRENDTRPKPSFPILFRRPVAALPLRANRNATTEAAPHRRDDDYGDQARGRRPANGRILQFCAISGKKQGEFNTVDTLARAYVKVNPLTSLQSAKSGINLVLTGKLPKFRNIYVRRRNDKSPMPSFPIGSAQGRVLQFCAVSGKKMGEFNNISKLAKAYLEANPGISFGTAKTGIRRVLIGELAKFRDIYVRHVDDTRPMPSFPIERAKKVLKATPILQFNVLTREKTGRFENGKEAAQMIVRGNPGVSFKVAFRNIGRVLCGHQPSYLNRWFRYEGDLTAQMPSDSSTNQNLAS